MAEETTEQNFEIIKKSGGQRYLENAEAERTVKSRWQERQW